MRTLWANVRSEPAGYAIATAEVLGGAFGWYCTAVFIAYGLVGYAVFATTCATWITGLFAYMVVKLREEWRSQ